MPTYPFKILVKYTSRGRPDRFLGGLQNIWQTCHRPEYVRVLVTADIDDKLMCNDIMRDEIAQYPNTHVIYGTSENKIHAINRDMDILPDDFKDWDIVANFSDDMRWTAEGWDEYIRVDANQVSPDMDCFLSYFDPDTKGVLSTLYIAGRKFYDMFGFIYDPQFKSLFCDNLIEDCAKALGKFKYLGYQIYHHYNPSYGYENFRPDAMYEEQQRVGWDLDQKLYYKIKSEGLENYLSQFNLKPL